MYYWLIYCSLMIQSHLSKQLTLFYTSKNKTIMAKAISRTVTCAGLLITCQKAVKLTCSSPLIPSEIQALLLKKWMRVQSCRSVLGTKVCLCECVGEEGDECVL